MKVVKPESVGLDSKILENVSDYLECNTTMLDFIDTGWRSNDQANPINGDIFTPIQEKINSKEWSMILTHGESGEYGHYHHVQVHVDHHLLHLH